MATSPNYAWAEPDNSSLVKNGAADIRTLGDAIDTSVWNVGYGQAAKNKIINGDFRVNQRSFSSTTTSGTYMFDRWGNYLSDGTVTYSAQTFTPGAAPVAGYESANFIRCVTSGQSAAGAAAQLAQPIEDVRTFAGQTVTISFWAKAATGTPKIGIELAQTFGSGGSSTVFSALGAVTISTSWVRYSATYAVPSISGKTIGTNSFLGVDLWTSAGTTFATRASSIGIQSATIDIWGVQIEAGSKATPFQTASGGSIQGELAAAQRYYYRANWDAKAAYPVFAQGGGYSTTSARLTMPFPVNMRVQPTAIESSALANLRVQSFSDGTSIAPSSISLDGNFTTTTMGFINAGVASGLTANALYYLRGEGSTAYYIGWSAEL
jgi:hypothetical protein